MKTKELRQAYYTATVSEFQKDVERGQYIEKMLLGGKFLLDTYNSETKSWEENAKVISKLLSDANLPNPDDVYVSFEYAAPVGGRVDCVLFGTGKDGKKNVILIELKQWGNQVEVFSAYGKRWVNVFVGGSDKIVDHPSEQAERYEIHFRNFVNLFDQEEYELTSLAYCYNYESKGKEGLFDDMFAELRERCPLYSKDMTAELSQNLHDLLCNGQGEGIAKSLAGTDLKPTKALIEAAANMMIDPNDNTFVLLGDQDDAYKTFWNVLKKTLDSNDKSVFIVKGGPGTGKTVIALKILSELYKEAMQNGKECNAYYATRSTALTKQLSEALHCSNGNQKKYTGGVEDLIQKTYQFRPACYKESQIDVLLVDEAHRVQEKSNDQTDGSLKKKCGVESVYCPLNQALSLIYCSKVTVFFIDDHQAVKNQEIGYSEAIKKIAENYQGEYIKQIEEFKAEYSNKTKPNAEKKLEAYRQALDGDLSDAEMAKIERNIATEERNIDRIKGLKYLTKDPLPNVNVYTHELTTQFRCVGADRFVAWVDNVLYKEVPNEKKFKLDKEDFDFKIFQSPQELEQEIRKLNDQEKEPKTTARIVAGWCWDWSSKADENGDLKKEIQIGDWSMPWETKANPSKEFKSQYARSADFWAKDPQGINQVGCIYSAQGFEFDYVGVILGPDIKYDAKKDALVCLPKLNKERNLTEKDENGDRLIRNIYKVLLTRGRKGCYMYSCDPKVSNYFKRFMNY